MTSPTELSLKALRKQGYTVGVTERWNAHTRVRQDLFGFADLLGMSEGLKPVLVQTTSFSNQSTRVAKIMASPEAWIAARAGFVILTHGWRKPKHRWECRELDLTQEILACPEKPSPPSSDIQASAPTTGSSSSTSRTRSTIKRASATRPPNS